MTQMNTWMKQTHRQRTYLWWPRGRVYGGSKIRSLVISRCNLLYIKWINNKVLLYSTGNNIQHPVINQNATDYAV